jgi:hypothetical protein
MKRYIPSFILYKANKKLLHFRRDITEQDAELAAIFETVLGHIDFKRER